MGSGTDNIEEFLEEDTALRKKNAEAAHPEHAQQNRYGDWWWWEEVKPNTYLFNITGTCMMMCRTMGDPKLDTIIAFDPSGGPYISLITLIDGKAIKRIRVTEEGYVADVT